MHDDSKVVLSTRDQVLARKRERQRLKDEETRRQLAAAREDVLKDRQRAKAKAIEQRMTSGSAVKKPLKKTSPKAELKNDGERQLKNAELEFGSREIETSREEE